MADNVSFDRRGRACLQFQDLGGIRRKMRLTGLNKKDVQRFASRFGELLSAVKGGLVPDPLLISWVGQLDLKFQRALDEYGIVKLRPPSNWSLLRAREAYLELKKGKKPATLRNIITASDRLFKILGPESLIASLTKGQCDHAVATLHAASSPASVSQSIKKTKAILNHAVNLEVIGSNPMGHIKPGSDAGDPDRMFFVTEEMAEKVLEACPNQDWKLIFGLTRYAGLRAPSELAVLSWKDVHWDKHYICVRSSKTEHHVGKKSRLVPIFPKLKPLLLAAFEVADDKNGLVVSLFRKKPGFSPRTRMNQIIESAGIKPWPKTFTNCRATCDTELRQRGVPDYKVDAWLGHSLTVAKKHYLQIVPSDYELAAGVESGSTRPKGALPETLRQVAVGAGKPDQDQKFELQVPQIRSVDPLLWQGKGISRDQGGSNQAPFGSKSGSKNDSASACNMLQAVTQGTGGKAFVRDSAGDCRILQEEKAPRLGLEPRTCELTARRSTN